MKQLIIIIAATLLASCGNGNKTNDAENNCIHKKWELSVINNEEIIHHLPIYIDLTADSELNGYTGCNRLTGSYTIENGNKIEFSKLSSTRMACREIEMERENQVLEGLKKVNNFRIDSGKLTLNAGQTPIATFYEMRNDEIVNKYWKLIELNGNAVQMAANQEREQYFILREGGRISGFAGCNHFNGKYKLSEGNGITIDENLAVTLMICPDVDIDESAYLRVLSLIDNYTIKGDTLKLCVGKKNPMAIFEAVYF